MFGKVVSYRSLASLQDLGSKAASKATEASREAASKAKEAKVGVDRLGLPGVVVYKENIVVPTGVMSQMIHFFWGERSKKLQRYGEFGVFFFVGLEIKCHAPCGERNHLEQGNDPLRKIMMSDRNLFEDEGGCNYRELLEKLFGRNCRE